MIFGAWTVRETSAKLRSRAAGAIAAHAAGRTPVTGRGPVEDRNIRIAFPRSWDYACRTGVGLRRSPIGKQEGAPKMLVLTRKSNQSIMIGDEIEVSVLSVMGEKVRIGIQAPQEVPVFRKEIYLEIHRETGAVTAENDGNSAESPSGEETAPGSPVDESLRELGKGGQPKSR
jgi:carbon storage regulator